MQVFIEPEREGWNGLCSRPSERNSVVEERVSRIIGRVREGGDDALLAIESELAGRDVPSFVVSPEEVAAAADKVSAEVKKAIERSAANIRAFHEAQLPHMIEVETSPGVKCIQKPVPIDKVGLYIPGGTAPLFSTVLMLAVPASIAGCREVVLCTPAQSPEVLYAASYCGVSRIFRLGGAQAIAAMAYGTQTVPKVDKIFGPGNQYVTTAKQMVSGDAVSIDMPAGPSEVMVIADSSTNPAFAAADLLSQAEHGRDSQVMLVCDAPETASAVMREVDAQVARLGREELALGALEHSRAVVLKELGDVVDFANAYAPEHLIILASEPWKVADRITAAGSVFVGAFTPESAGDYASGTNHTLPTCAWARSCSGVNTESFMRRMTIQEISREGLAGLSGTIMAMAEAEGLQAHANAVKIRTDERD